MKSRFCIKNVTLKISLFCFSVSALFFLALYSEASGRPSLKLSPNESISFLCFKVYGRYNPEMLTELSKINQNVSDWDNLPAGKDIRLLTQNEMNSMVPEKNKDFLVITFLQHPARIQRHTQTTFTKAKLNMILNSYEL